MFDKSNDLKNWGGGNFGKSNDLKKFWGHFDTSNDLKFLGRVFGKSNDPPPKQGKMAAFPPVFIKRSCGLNFLGEILTTNRMTSNFFGGFLTNQMTSKMFREKMAAFPPVFY